MIRIQELKEPKKTSGEKLDPGKSIHFKDVKITNNKKNAVYIDWYKRKPWKKGSNK